GFFGSGKSHFIKILSYLLENKTVTKDGESRQAFDFFKDKITDAMLLGDIRTAISKNTDVILFNIDSRANTDDKEDAILKVFLKVFNERLGYCGDHPHIAHMERELDNRGQYQAFQEAFTKLTDSTWLSERDAFDFYRDEMGQALSTATGQSEDSTRQWVENLETNFALDIQNFCEWVKAYLDKSGSGTDGKHLLFLVDEVGQFIGQNTQMMLKLQTITETLGTVCAGRAWVIVTSQADIDAVLGEMNTSKGNDFSKIQGRFYTRIALSSSNTNEVIQKRLLEKTEPARENLSSIYAQKGDILRNQLSFDKTTTAELSNYSDNVEFIDNYPFIPYQYLLVQKVFESIRSKGATGKHLAMGERSLLDAFQTAAKQIKDKETDVLIPFHCFYASIESFLEPAVKRTIDQACQKDSLSNFDNNILKTLFLIRYVDVVKSTLDNLVTLSIDKIDADKIALRKEIDDSLNRLERQLLISRNSDEFVFLTNEEKEIENEIRHTEIEGSEETRELSNLIYDDILGRQNKYRYPVNKYDYDMSRFCNGHPKDGSTLHDLVVKVISPIDVNYEQFTQQQCLDHSVDSTSPQNQGSVVIKLGNSERIWKDLQTYLKTERFLRQNQGERPEQEHLLRDKALENNDRRKHLKIELENLLKEAEFYAIGNKLTPKASSVSGMLDESFQYVIENTFSKLNMLKVTSGDLNRELQSIVTADDMDQIGLDLNDPGVNP
ncbi:MAG: BREX system P-loop protein BrxC, partial [Thiotrichaceae bacterium]|nr:BREX system P-loop protein BrxC [Thiotrichaceae bacterium]